LQSGRLCEKFAGKARKLGTRPEGVGLSAAVCANKSLRNEAYLVVRRNDEGRSATQHPDFFQSRPRNKKGKPNKLAFFLNFSKKKLPAFFNNP
jgi:hypothetical protein